MKRIFLLGSLNCDITVRAPYLPESGETLKGSDFMITAGGKGANQAYACAALGGSVKMAGAVGKDAFGDMLLNSLQGVGVDVSYIRRVEENTGTAMITVINGDNRIILSEGANGVVTEKDISGLLADAVEGDIFVTQLENPFQIILHALKAAKEKGLFTVFNPAPAFAEAKEAVEYSDIIIPNRKELKLLTGKDGLDEGCEELLRLGAGAVIVTLGAKGSYLYTNEKRTTVYSVDCGKVIDTTGAGDTFCGGICVQLAEGEDMEVAMRFASVCSGIAVTRRGAQIAVPKREELKKFY